METTFDHFRHRIPMPLRWSDLDAMGHVNNAKYLTYLEQARIRYCEDVGFWDGRSGGIGLIMARVELDYRIPLEEKDPVYVYTRVARIGNRSMETEQWIVRDHDGALQIAAQGKVTVVAYDYHAGQSAPVPASWRDHILAYEPAPVVC